MATIDPSAAADRALSAPLQSLAQPTAAGADGTVGACLAQHRQLQYEVSHYIERLLAELGTMARAAELGHLLYFLEMTRQEAAGQTRRYRLDP